MEKLFLKGVTKKIRMISGLEVSRGKLRKNELTFLFNKINMLLILTVI